MYVYIHMRSICNPFPIRRTPSPSQATGKPVGFGLRVHPQPELR